MKNAGVNHQKCMSISFRKSSSIALEDRSCKIMVIKYDVKIQLDKLKIPLPINISWNIEDISPETEEIWEQLMEKQFISDW